MLKYLVVGIIIFFIYRFMIQDQRSISKPDNEFLQEPDDGAYSEYEELDN